MSEIKSCLLAILLLRSCCVLGKVTIFTYLTNLLRVVIFSVVQSGGRNTVGLAVGLSVGLLLMGIIVAVVTVIVLFFPKWSWAKNIVNRKKFQSAPL